METNSSHDTKRLLIDQVAENTGMTKRTIRYYEEIGLLPATDRSEGNYRLYTEADVVRLQRIGKLKHQLGLSLEAVARLLEVEESLDTLRSQFRSGADRTAKLLTLDSSETLLAEYLSLVEDRIHTLESEKQAVLARLAKVTAKRQELRLPNE